MELKLDVYIYCQKHTEVRLDLEIHQLSNSTLIMGEVAPCPVCLAEAAAERSGMILTVEEARGRWCPMARMLTDGENPASYNRYFSKSGLHTINEGAFCIDKFCMFWRWVEDKIKYESEDYGYCGMAGKPAGVK